jgi:hypothetical protein
MRQSYARETLDGPISLLERLVSLLARFFSSFSKSELICDTRCSSFSGSLSIDAAWQSSCQPLCAFKPIYNPKSKKQA